MSSSGNMLAKSELSQIFSARQGSIKRNELQLLRGILAVSVVLNLVLAYNVHSLRLFIGDASGQVEATTGFKVGPINVHDMAGGIHIIDFAGTEKPTVVYFFRPDCHWCVRNLSNIETLAQKTSGEFRFVGLAREQAGLDNYVQTNSFNFPIYGAFNLTRLDGLKIGSGTPQTLVISQDGTVVRNWMGAFNEKTESEVEAYFKVKLPGLLPDQSAQ